MGTRSTIALEFADGTVQAVYCHWDGYLSHNGRILQDHYLDPFKVRQLIDLGDLSTLSIEIGSRRPFDNPYKWGTPEFEEFQTKYGSQCLFYGRDRGETGVEARVYANIEDYFSNHRGEEFDYLLRCVDGRPVWFVQHDYTNSRFMPLVAELEREAAEQE